MAVFDAIFRNQAGPVLDCHLGDAVSVEYRPPNAVDTPTDPIQATIRNDRWEFVDTSLGLMRQRVVEVIIPVYELAAVQIRGVIYFRATGHRLESTDQPWSVNQILAESETYHYIEAVEMLTAERTRDTFRFES